MWIWQGEGDAYQMSILLHYLTHKGGGGQKCQKYVHMVYEMPPGMWGPYDLQIVDKLKIPEHLIPGDYVLGWRWDCEESTQIWSSCSDVTIENNDY